MNTKMVQESFKCITPAWPLKNMIAVNPLSGYEDLRFEEALKMGETTFERSDFPEAIHRINRQTIKWMQVCFDEGQATFSMFLKSEGLYQSWHRHAVYDSELHNNISSKIEWLRALPKNPEAAIEDCLEFLKINPEEKIKFLEWMLITLPGWAAHVKHISGVKNIQTDYMAIRLIITAMLWPDARELLQNQAVNSVSLDTSKPLITTIEESESQYRRTLLRSLTTQKTSSSKISDAQFVFCIDVRSEPFRKALESVGNYETFGFAGFFGIPLKIHDQKNSETYSSCPVLLRPKHEVQIYPDHDPEQASWMKSVYQSLKYTFTTPFTLVELIGPLSGVSMFLRCFLPRLGSSVKKWILKIDEYETQCRVSVDSIPMIDQVNYAKGFLQSIGLTRNFAQRIVLCGHGSTTENNAYASALDCGACAGRQGGINARVLSAILNQDTIRATLRESGIDLPETTRFIAAQHNTTTDTVDLYEPDEDELIQKMLGDLNKAREINCAKRIIPLRYPLGLSRSVRESLTRSQDWAQVRPEWGLARNAAFLVAPRSLSTSVDLEGRCFLHSYDHTQDPEGNTLTGILTAPMVVAQWINSQYFFSTLNNVAYGGGSKITKNITGKFGIMQGNGSDLMTGLPLQSVYRDNFESYHHQQRLLTIIYAPPEKILTVVNAQPILKKLFGNGWVSLSCIDPNDNKTYFLRRDFTWGAID